MSKKRKSSRAKSARSSRRNPPTFFQKIGNWFSSIFTAPSADKAEKKRAKLVKEIKAHGYSLSYEKRLLRAVESGKAPSLQAARGHKPGEARQRQEKERAAQGGLTSREIAAIKNFHSRFDPHGIKSVSANAMIEFSQKAGYKVFQQYRVKWDAMRKAYVRQQRDGTYVSMGESYLSDDDIDYSRDDMDADFEDIDYHIPMEWFYYH